MSETAEVVEKYADKLVGLVGDTAPEAGALLVEAQVIDEFQLLLSFFVCVMLSAASLFGAKWQYKLELDPELGSYDRKAAAASRIEGITGFCLVSIAFLVASMFSLGDGLGHLYSPESYALQNLVQSLK